MKRVLVLCIACALALPPAGCSRQSPPRPAITKPPPPKPPDLGPLTIQIVKNSDIGMSLSDRPQSLTVQAFMKTLVQSWEGRINKVEWTSAKQPNGMYLVIFTIDSELRGPVDRFGWEVEMETEAVRFVNKDRSLADSYGLPFVDMSDLSRGSAGE